MSEANTQNVVLIFGPYQKHKHKLEMSEANTQNVGLIFGPYQKHTHKLEMSEEHLKCMTYLWALLETNSQPLMSEANTQNVGHF